MNYLLSFPFKSYFSEKINGQPVNGGPVKSDGSTAISKPKKSALDRGALVFQCSPPYVGRPTWRCAWAPLLSLTLKAVKGRSPLSLLAWESRWDRRLRTRNDVCVIPCFHVKVSKKMQRISMETYMCSARTCENSFAKIVICRLYKKNPAQQQKGRPILKIRVCLFCVCYVSKYNVCKFCMYVV